MQHVRVDHGAERQLLQVRELRQHEWLCVGKRYRHVSTQRRRGAENLGE
jgi:hypothetical protein